MVWDKEKIVVALKKLHKQGDDISYNALSKKMQSLVSASAYHFGSFRIAVEHAGIDYAEVMRRPRWTKGDIIKAIKDGRRKRHELHWSAVTKRHDELGRAAFASLQARMFGSWDRALQAAGLDADEINRYRKWDKNTVIAELRARSRDNQSLNSGAVQKEDPGLHAASIRRFANFDDALRAAKLDPSKVRQRKMWDETEVLKQLKLARKAGEGMSDSTFRKVNLPLYGAAKRLFGSFSAARDAAGIKLPNVARASRT